MREYMRSRLANDPEFREKHRESLRRHRQRHPEAVAAKNAKRQERYWNDPEYREMVKARDRAYKAAKRAAKKRAETVRPT